MKSVSKLRAALSAALLIACVTPGAAFQNSYGGYSIGGDPDYEELPYGTTRGWSVFYAQDEYGRIVYCAASIEDRGTPWRIGTDGGQWQVAVVANAPAEFDAQLEIDGKSSSIIGIELNGWALLWLGLQDVNDLAYGDRMIVDIGRASVAHPLTGTAAVITMIDDCIRTSGGTAYQLDNGVEVSTTPVLQPSGGRGTVAPMAPAPSGGGTVRQVPAAAPSEPYSYVAARDGNIPRDALAVGYDSNGDTLFSCLVEYNGGLQPGKIRPGFSGCHFGYGGIEYENTVYSVLVGLPDWWQGSNGDLPQDMIAVGYEADGRPLGVCRVQFGDNGLQVGKIGPSTGSCNIAYGGSEYTLYDYYEVMTR